MISITLTHKEITCDKCGSYREYLRGRKGIKNSIGYIPGGWYTKYENGKKLIICQSCLARIKDAC